MSSKLEARLKVGERTPRLTNSRAGSVEYREGREAAGGYAVGAKPQVGKSNWSLGDSVPFA